ncbi:hypothetical protein [Pseudoruegeria sp. HB172150]|uniref:hypothetical protein n=1 Tax=Pseudoruegeria sp. HB172150 TaxID=2721164 RepID=UPI001C12D050|nr:hypothetical protein [Pseudoruegeria sp. HB172150]
MAAGINGGSEANEMNAPGPSETELLSYFVCSDMAEAGLLPRDIAAACSITYLKVKLSFLPGVGLDDYLAIDAASRAQVSRAGYDALRDWYRQNPARVDALRERVRAQSVAAVR